MDLKYSFIINEAGNNKYVLIMKSWEINTNNEIYNEVSKVMTDLNLSETLNLINAFINGN